MSPTYVNILSISFSKNRLAFAVFQRGQLEFYAGRTLYRCRTSPARIRKMVLTLEKVLKDHRINKLAMLRLNKQQRHSSELRGLYGAIRRFCTKNGLVVVTQDPVQMRQKLTGDARPSKANVLARLIQIFPELKRYASGGSEWERRYYGHVFTAIGSGLVAAGFARSGSGEGAIE